MQIGVTGSRYGATHEQLTAFRSLLAHYAADIDVFRHGACFGVDEEATQVVWDTFGHAVTIVAHPSDLAKWTSRKAVRLSTTVLPAKPPLARNRDIVNEVDMLIVIPQGPEENRSGTWACCRYCRSVGKAYTIIWPDGKTEQFEGTK